MRETLPEASTFEFLLEHAIDIIVSRTEMRDKLASLLSMLSRARSSRAAPRTDAS